MKKFWNVNKTTNEIYLYGDIEQEQFFETDYTAQAFIADIKSFNGAAFTVRINSNGGDVFVALAIANLIKNYPAEVKCYIDGICASAATLIAFSGNSVTMANNALLMTHSPTVGLSGFMTEQDLQAAQESLSKVKNSILATYASKLNKSVDEIADMLDAETWYTAAEALEAGLIDAIEGEADLKIDNAQKAIFYNSLAVKGDYNKLKGLLNVEDKTLIDKIKNLLSGKSDPESIRDGEVNRIKNLNAARGKNNYVNAIIDSAIAKGARLEDVQDYIDAVQNVTLTETDKTAQAIFDLIKDNMTSGAGEVGGSFQNEDSKKTQAALIAKYANQ